MQVRFWGTRGSYRNAAHRFCDMVEARLASVLMMPGLDRHRAAEAGTISGNRSRAPGPPSDQPHPLGSHPGAVLRPVFGTLATSGKSTPRVVQQSLEGTLAGQMQSTYFRWSLGSRPRYFLGRAISDRRCGSPLAISIIRRSRGRLAADGAVLVRASDHEPHARARCWARDGQGQDQRMPSSLRTRTW